MKKKLEPSTLLYQLNYLSDRKDIIKDWIEDNPEKSNIGAIEMYNTLFDDLLMDRADEIYDINEETAYYIKLISEFLHKASPEGVEICVDDIVNNRDFVVAQKLAELIQV